MSTTSNYPDWQSKARAQHALHKARLVDEATRRAKERANKLHKMLTAAGVNVPAIDDPAWVYETYWLNDAPRIHYWLNYEGYHFSMAVSVKELVTVAKGDVVAIANVYPGTDVLNICDALDKVDRMSASGVEVGAAD